MKSETNKKYTSTEELLEVLKHFQQLLKGHSSYLDSLNVFPVPDGDTGSNMYLTMKSAMDALGGMDKTEMADLPTIAKVITEGAVRGARGNSGVLLSQAIKGFLETFSSYGKELDAKAWVEGAQVASRYAYEAVSEPKEGTMLTVISEIAEGGNAALKGGAGFEDVVRSFQSIGKKSLEKTPELLEALKKAGVVDAGGAGLLLIFDALAFVVMGQEAPPPPQPANVLNLNTLTVEPDGTRYEVMFILEAVEEKISEFRKSWELLGDSIVISGTGKIWNCHIHTDEIGKSIEAGISCGTPKNIRVTDLYLDINHEDTNWGITLESDSKEEFVLLDTQLKLEQVTTQALIAANGDGLVQIFGSLGARVIIVGGQTQNPTAKTFLDAISQIEADQILILPNNLNICAVVNSLSEQSPKTIKVVESKTIPEGLSAMLVYDPATTAESNATRMEQAIEGVVSGEVTRAVRDSESHSIKEGDFIGLDSVDILTSSSSLVSTTCDLLRKLITPSHELLTLIAGSEVTDSDSQKIIECLAHNYPDIEVEVIQGGQDLYHYHIGLE